MFKNKKFWGVPCPDGCVAVSGPNRLPITTKHHNPFGIITKLKEFHIGTDAPDE